MTIFFTSDHHFGHANILKYEDALRRNAHGGQFHTVEQMDDYLIDQWNATVSPGDTVYHLGDLSFKLHTIEEVMPFLNGNVVLVVGNHDPFFKRLNCAIPRMQREAREDALRLGFSEVHLQLDVEISGIGQVSLSHFPYAPPDHDALADYELRFLENRPVMGEEKLLLHGHVHSQWLEQTYRGLPPMINVGVEMWGLRPVSEAEIVERFRKKLYL